MDRKTRMIILFLHLIFGLYFINFTFQFVTIPASIIEIEKWLIFVGGVLILFGAFSYLRASRNYY